jgi:2-hydroxy-3-keto-5-methylthiopentenyl-1-phosphate phosphatase
VNDHLPVRSIVVDFDGTISIDDVSDGLFAAFAEPGWREIDLEFERGAIGSRECIERQTALLRGTPEELETYSVEHFPVDPTFPPFVAWARGAGLEVSVASDGVGLHVLPLLASVGLRDLPVLTNRPVSNGRWRMEFPNGHPECVRCGTCKMNATLRARKSARPTAFVGDGHSDTYGAQYADVVFAKRFLADYCRDMGVPFIEWETFDDVRAAVEKGLDVPGPVDPPRCPGWTVPGDTSLPA